MTSDLSNLTEEERAFLQKRVALFGKVLLGINILALVVQAPHIAREPSALGGASMWWLYTATALSAVVWLLCRRGERSALFVRAVEAAGVLAYVFCVLVMARYLLLIIIPMYLDRAHITDPSVPAEVIGLAATGAQLHMGALLGLAFTQVLAVRAALVPTTARYTAVLTTLVGVLFIGVTAFGIPGLAPYAVISAQTPDRFGFFAVWHFAIWWGFTIIVCAIISKVVFGLRQQVRAAQQLGQYALEEKLGEGGMGIVYRARHQLLRRPTAVKLLPPDKAGKASVERFAREVRLTSLLTHPNTVTIFDYGHTPSGVFYYAMELLDGASLETVVEVGGPMPVERVSHVLWQVLGALHEAHGVGLIHRDIKPANIMLCTSGAEHDVAKVLDFGLVKDVKQDEGVSLTAANVITGTPQYMAPEMITHPSNVDARADLYSLGAVAYFLLAGEHLFAGGTLVEVCSHHLHTEPPPPSKRRGSDVAADLEAWVLACLAKDPDERPQSAAEARERLAACTAVDRWSQADARDWWSEHGEACRAEKEPPAEERPSLRTVAVALDRRT
ncbi:MAG: serine/threonine protein kinase [Deltaproteobacteria bacterium]|jgi:serine/threonine-protein kinase|nr:serine/threonine protein kinase [Deltaproteobacteria bacterium]MBW2536783.1 serine/threonine protein kinase [Deltaproteobacteria bacterium]